MADPLYAAGGAGVATRRLDRLVHLLLPAPCQGCGAPLPARVAPLGLCAPCRGRLRPLGRSGCALCGAEVAPGEARCGACRGSAAAVDRLLAAWSYAPPLDGVIAGLKFRRLDYLGRHLAAGMAEVLGEALAGFDAVAAVPLHWRRRLARGYDQAERIADPLAELLGIPFVRALRRCRATAPQSALGRGARLANPRGAFTPRRGATSAGGAGIAGRRLLLVDDVATTGATLGAAAEALRSAGAAAVTAAVAGRTPLGGAGIGQAHS